jgi:flagellar hook-length control protein FliK
MNLHGLINRQLPGSSSGEGKPSTPAPAAPSGNFGDIVTGNLPQPVRQDGEPAAGPGVSLPPGLSPAQFPAAILPVADLNATDQLIGDPAQNLDAEAPFTIAVDDAAEPVPDLEHPHGVHAQPPVAPNRSPSGRVDLIFATHVQTEASLPRDAVPQAAVVVAASPAASAPPTSRPATSAPAASGVAFGIVPKLQGASVSTPPFNPEAPADDPDATNSLPRDAGKAGAILPGATPARTAKFSAAVPFAIPVTPDAPGSAQAPTQMSAPALVPEPRPPAMANAIPVRAGKNISQGTIQRPDLKPEIGDRAPRQAPDVTRLTQAKLPAEATPEPGTDPAPDLPDIPAMARGRATLVHDAVMQARTDLSQIGLAASAAATAQSTSAPAQLLASTLQANAGGAEIARMVAPQIATAIGSGPSSGRIELRLDPPELGKVEILLEISEMSLRATVIAERPMVNEMLRRHGDVLLTQLQQAGFTGVDLQFGGNRAGNQPGSHADDTHRPAFARDPDAHADGAHADNPADHQARRTSDRLDLRL